MLEIILKEGRNKQIRRAADLLGHPVIDLQRTAIGPLKLDTLREGSWRIISKSEWLPLIKTSKSKVTS